MHSRWEWHLAHSMNLTSSLNEPKAWHGVHFFAPPIATSTTVFSFGISHALVHPLPRACAATQHANACKYCGKFPWKCALKVIKSQRQRQRHAGNPGMQASKPGIIPIKPGIFSSKPGICSSKPVTFSSKPGTFSSKPGRANRVYWAPAWFARGVPSKPGNFFNKPGNFFNKPGMGSYGTTYTYDRGR